MTVHCSLFTDMHPDPQTIPTPIPKTDPPSLRKPLRLALLRALGFALSPIPSPNPSTSLRISLGEGRRGEGQTRILLIRPDHLGDMLCVTPALRFLRAQMPDAHVTALVGSWAEPVIANNPYVDDVQTLEFPGFTRRPKSSFLVPYTRL